MSFYRIMVFIHILTAIGLTGGALLQWLLLRGAAAAKSGEEASGLIRLTNPGSKIVIFSAILVLVSGIYLAVQEKAFAEDWINTSFAAIAIIAVTGAVTGRAGRVLRGFAAEGKEEEVRKQLRNPVPRAVMHLQITLILAVIFLMVVRGGAAVCAAAMAVAVIWAALWSLPLLGAKYN